MFCCAWAFAGDNGGGTSGGENVRTSGASDYRFLCADIDDNAHSADRCHRIYFEALQRVGVPAHEIAMMMTIALRFIPTL